MGAGAPFIVADRMSNAEPDDRRRYRALPLPCTAHVKVAVGDKVGTASR
jgi:hypothetical protein